MRTVNSLILTLINLLAGGAINSNLVPVRVLETDNKQKASRY
ncbi:MAG: hypothetical protein K0S09_3129 [Sphingobacteriaceae bacterium]|jgi:hypothetical protein|nr:hypothetical protein [Sphingobacteriaceae bacterium]